MEVLRIINEPTAAAIAYGLDKKVELSRSSSERIKKCCHQTFLYHHFIHTDDHFESIIQDFRLTKLSRGNCVTVLQAFQGAVSSGLDFVTSLGNLVSVLKTATLLMGLISR